MATGASTSCFRLLESVEYAHEFLKKGLHPPDGRKLLDFRSTSLQTNLLSSSDGSSLVRHGNTVVVASVKGELSEPDFKGDSNEKGRVVLSVDGQPYFSDFQNACLNDASALIKNLFDANKIVDLNSLCILKGKLCWTLFVDVNCLDCDGAVFETSLLAVVSAFYYATLPTVRIEGEEQQAPPPFSAKGHDDNDLEKPETQLRQPAVGEIFAPFFNSDDDWSTADGTATTIDFDEPSNNSGVRVDFKDRKPIALTRSLPVASGFLLFDIEQTTSGDEENVVVEHNRRRCVLACDPTEEIKNVFPNNDFALVYSSPKTLTNQRRRNVDERCDEALCGVHKYGGSVTIDEQTLDQCVALARRRCHQVLRLIDQSKPSRDANANQPC